MAMTANGYIAKTNNDTPWSNEEWLSFSKKVQEAKNLIVGRKTFEIMKKGDEFEKIGKPLTIVVSEKQTGFNFVNSPEKAVDFLKKKGFSEILVAGGGKLNTSFMQKGLIDEVYLDIEPFVFGSGIKLFADGEWENKLKLLGTKLLSKNVVQIHYKVIKKYV